MADTELEILRERVRQLEAALKVYEDIVSDSHGVSGYHLNGDIAEWDEFDLPQTAGAPNSCWRVM